MKKTHKKIIGLFGLAFVAVTTVYAAFLPTPETHAIDDVVDNIEVRVVGSTPEVDFDNIDINPGDVISDWIQTIVIPYDNVDDLIIKLHYTDEDGHETVIDLIDANANYAPGELTATLNFLTGEYTYTYQYYDDTDKQIHTRTVPSGTDPAPVFEPHGYGDYVLEVIGIGAQGAIAGPKEIPFEMNPIGDGTGITVEKEGDEDKYYLDIDYRPDAGEGDPANQTDKIEVRIFDENGNEVSFSPLIVKAPETRIEIPFDEYNLPNGTYTFWVTPYNIYGNPIYKVPAYVFTFEYTGESLPVPDTGGLFTGANISRTDYLITGLLIFGLVGVGGAVFIARHDKKSGLKRRK